MKTVDEHVSEILGAVGPVEPIHVALLEGRGCLLAEHVAAPDALPAFDNSALDGYAVRAGDVAAATADGPVTLPVTADIAAGAPGFFSVRRGMCVRIMTGAPMPSGADAVVPVEQTDGGTSRVRIDRAATEGQGIRRRGEDVQPGEVVLSPGTRLDAPQLGLLAAVGRGQVNVRPRPRVVVLSTGNELVEPGAEIRPGQLVDANSYTLTAAAIEVGAVAYRYGIVGDDPRQLLDVLEDQLVRADAIVTSGGVSMGAYDVVKEVLAKLGTVHFERVAMQPGMPQGFGMIELAEQPSRRASRSGRPSVSEDARGVSEEVSAAKGGGDTDEERRGTPIFTLPGNPVSAYVSFQVFVRPALRRMAGLDPEPLPTVRATLTTPLTASAGKRTFARARLERGDEGYRVTPVGGHGSHLQADLAAADALAVVPEDITRLDAGEDVDVMSLARSS